TLPELFRAGRPDPSARLLTVPGGTDLTYGEADRRTAQLARVLRDLGVGAGDRVAVQAPKSPTLVLLYLACVRTGAVLLPMNTAYTDAEVAYLLGDAAPRLFVRDAGEARSDVQQLTVDALDALAAERPGEFEDVEVRPDDLAALLYTSGTTGKPKGAKLTQA